MYDIYALTSYSGRVFTYHAYCYPFFSSVPFDTDDWTFLLIVGRPLNWKVLKKSYEGMHSLLKAGNLFGLTAYMSLIMKWGVAKIWDLFWGHFWVNLSKNHDICQKWRRNSGLTACLLFKGCLPIYNILLIMKLGILLIWDFIVGLFWVNLSKNHDFCQK